MIQVALMCGVSGSGKSIFSTKVLPRIKGLIPTIYSADLERLDRDGNYVYKPEDNNKVHKKCRKKFTKHIIGLARNRRDRILVNALVVVDNTSTTPAELAFFWDMAKTYDVYTEIYRMVPPGWPKIDDLTPSLVS